MKKNTVLFGANYGGFRVIMYEKFCGTANVSINTHYKEYVLITPDGDVVSKDKLDDISKLLNGQECVLMSKQDFTNQNK